MFSLKTVWEHYSKLLSRDFGVEAGAYKGNHFKLKVEQYFGSDKVTLVQPLDVQKPLMIVPSSFTDITMRTVLNDLSEEEQSSEEDDIAAQHTMAHCYAPCVINRLLFVDVVLA